MRRHKVCVKVNIDFSLEGELYPRSITWTEGRIYEITQITERVCVVSTKVGGCGIRYRLIIDRCENYLFREEDK